VSEVIATPPWGGLKDLSQYKLYVATPMYGGKCYGLYMNAGSSLARLGAEYGLQVNFANVLSDALITRARNFLVDDFLRSDFTHLLFIDADIVYSPADVLTMLGIGKEVIGAAYAKKRINWVAVKKAVLRNPEIDPEVLGYIHADLVLNLKLDTREFEISEPLEVEKIGTGFMMIARSAFEKWKAAYPDRRYKPDVDLRRPDDPNGEAWIHAFFDTYIDKKENHRYLSEDYTFCQLWREMGEPLWLCPWMKTQHLGTYAFSTDIGLISKVVGSL
jgi:hypothetical protein